MPKRISARGVKTHRTYRFDQLADIVGVTVGTVRNWCRKGLPCITEQRPFLIRGRDFKQFHEAHLKSRRQKLAPFEVYCLTCKRPVSPCEGVVDYEPMDAGRSLILTLCPHCTGTARRIVSARSLRAWASKFGFAINKRSDA
jgi:hypothetical protein